MDEQEIAAGFNIGYIMSKYQPDLYELLQPSLNPGDIFHVTITQGANQWRHEEEQERLSELDNLNGPTQENEHDYS